MLLVTTDLAEAVVGMGGGATDMVKRHMVAVNVSPIDKGHVLLVPEPTSCLPQVNEPPTVQCKLFPSFVCLFVLQTNQQTKNK